MDAVTIDRASKHFGDDVAVDTISMSVAAGTIVGIIGPSGAGKTTLVRMYDRGARPDRRRDQGHGRGPAALPAPNPRAHRLHATVLRPVPRPDGPGERRLRRVAVRDAVVASTAPDARRCSSSSTLVGPRPASRPTSGGMQRRLEVASALRARSGHRVPRRADGRDRPDLRGRIWTSCAAAATTAGPSWSRPSTSTRPKRATRRC